MVNRQQRGGQQPQALMQNQPQVPPVSMGVDHSFTLQSIMEQQKALGKLEGVVESQTKCIDDLTKAIAKQADQIYKINKTLWVCAAVIATAATLITFIFGNQLTDILNAVDALRTAKN